MQCCEIPSSQRICWRASLAADCTDFGGSEDNRNFDENLVYSPGGCGWPAHRITQRDIIMSHTRRRKLGHAGSYPRRNRPSAIAYYYRPLLETLEHRLLLTSVTSVDPLPAEFWDDTG